MISATSNKIIKIADHRCSKAGVKLTPNRRNILHLMLEEKKALSAYEIASLLQSKLNISLPAMSVYRNLDFLKDKKLVHKISSINKYTICNHILCEHDHEFMRLAICSQCLKVKELISKSSVIRELRSTLDDIGFHLKSEHIELIGLCSNCNK